MSPDQIETNKAYATAKRRIYIVVSISADGEVHYHEPGVFMPEKLTMAVEDFAALVVRVMDPQA